MSRLFCHIFQKSPVLLVNSDCAMSIGRFALVVLSGRPKVISADDSHENIICILDIVTPPTYEDFTEVYLVQVSSHPVTCHFPFSGR
jgi:hypothetical protein